MDTNELKGKIRDLLKSPQLASLATVTEDGKPWVRYLMSMGMDDLTIFMVTSLSSRKVAHIRAHPDVHVTMGGDSEHMDHPYVNIVATANILDDAASRKKIWRDELKQYFSGPDDPDFCILRIVPSVIEYLGPGMMKPLVYRP
jgi:general stress protein 26